MVGNGSTASTWARRAYVTVVWHDNVLGGGVRAVEVESSSRGREAEAVVLQPKSFDF
jgi:hypothetical protein